MLLKALAKGANILESENVKKCIRMGITELKIVIWGGKSLIYGHKLDFMAPLACRHVTKFLTINR